ncbi:hypothetical protein TCAL_04625 [Tigriopus californicus]|uniref:COX assembly mitochondrial protein n=1 Tax=Tigriopus californicus TaxID=6832 RepID=A0A553NG01_TIGCA|nr:COX assembly mitochondrial protein homolog [Tigriopus californicus]TRY64318.1 hypothetical protein TCAL_04625 [Tigriopus californicus]
MGNMLSSRRVQESLHIDDSPDSNDKRLFPSHMYTGPLKLGDPNYRELSNMEKDPLIPQRMRDVSRELCPDEVKKFLECGKKEGLASFYQCQGQKDEMVKCIAKWQDNPQFKEAITQEYLNERSHYRQTGIRTSRYQSTKYIHRDPNDPPLGPDGQYRPRKPAQWDESYPNGAPEWAGDIYK